MFPIDRSGQDGEGNLNSLLYDSVMEGKPEKYFYPQTLQSTINPIVKKFKSFQVTCMTKITAKKNMLMIKRRRKR